MPMADIFVRATFGFRLQLSGWKRGGDFFKSASTEMPGECEVKQLAEQATPKRCRQSAAKGRIETGL
jgi:hypothetical protein